MELQFVESSGPLDAEYLIVGEAPGRDEVTHGAPFVGVSGRELTRMLEEAGIQRSRCRIVNVCPFRPPGNDLSEFFRPRGDFGAISLRGLYPDFEVWLGLGFLWAEIRRVRPKAIIAFGNYSLWALTQDNFSVSVSKGKARPAGIGDWRGSMLYARDGTPVLATYHPAAILRMWEWRRIAVRDLKRLSQLSPLGRWPDPKWSFTIRPSFRDTITQLDSLLEKLDAGEQLRLSHDAETRLGHIACWGVAWSANDAICIPFMCIERTTGYWTVDQEIHIVDRLRRILRHPNAVNIGQNFSYDAQYTAQWWACIPRLTHDTMIQQHVAFAGLPKGLDFLSSMYCHYHYFWKNEGKLWDRKTPEDQLWVYNCKDACVTWEVCGVLEDVIEKLGLQSVYEFQIQKLWPMVLRTMIRGVRVDLERKSQVALEVLDAIAAKEEWLAKVIPLRNGKVPWYRSPQQTMNFLYEDLKLQPVLHRKTGRPSADDEALHKLAMREPLLKPIVRQLLALRSLSVFNGTFLESRPDSDRRMRTLYNIAGTETYRFSSSQNAFGSGMNLQNIPKGGEDLPNIRRLFIPDPGYLICDSDLERADLQVVVWEANDLELKQMIAEGADIHTENAKVLGVRRQLAKSWVHGTNYGGGPRTMAVVCGITVAQAEQMQKRWFEAHPGILAWHEKVQRQLFENRFVANAFGYRRFYFGRIEGVLKEALAWIPQSTVACVINRAWNQLETTLPWVRVLMQVHDSLVYQIPKDRLRDRKLIHENMLVPVPYEDPLIIGVNFATSETSWGDCKAISWD